MSSWLKYLVDHQQSTHYVHQFPPKLHGQARPGTCSKDRWI